MASRKLTILISEADDVVIDEVARHLDTNTSESIRRSLRVTHKLLEFQQSGAQIMIVQPGKPNTLLVVV